MEELFDALARGLAKALTRREALRVALGTALVTVWPRHATAVDCPPGQSPCVPDSPQCCPRGHCVIYQGAPLCCLAEETGCHDSCAPQDMHCCGSQGLGDPGFCYDSQICDRSSTPKQCVTRCPDGTVVCENVGAVFECCGPNESCVDGFGCSPMCPDGWSACYQDACCPPDQYCDSITRSCVSQCPSYEVRCAQSCCFPGRFCQLFPDGPYACITQCVDGSAPCGQNCCPPVTHYCLDPTLGQCDACQGGTCFNPDLQGCQNCSDVPCAPEGGCCPLAARVCLNRSVCCPIGELCCYRGEPNEQCCPAGP
jgi:hypothetical protein